MSTRLVDEFQSELERRGMALPGELTIDGIFGDFLWPPCGTRAEILDRHENDPGFTITGYSRWFVLERVVGEIRYYAASLAGVGFELTCDDVRRVAAIRAEPDQSELGVFSGIADAVSFMSSYLAGIPLDRIEVFRTSASGKRHG